MKLIILALALLTSAVSLAEQKEGNGGSGVAAEFMSLGNELVTRLGSMPVSEVSSATLKNAIETTKISVKKQLVLRGNAVDAINYPSRKLIEVSSSRWEKLAAKPWLQLQLVFHEYLGILGIDDSQYEVSKQILTSDLCSRAQGVKEAVEFELSRPCENVSLMDLFYLKKLMLRSLESFNASDFKDMPNLNSLEINNADSVALTPKFTALLPNLTSLDIAAKTVTVAPKTFAKSAPFTYLALSNVQVAKGSLAGLKAKMIALFFVPQDKAELAILQNELRESSISCAMQDNTEDSNYSNLFCMTN